MNGNIVLFEDQFVEHNRPITLMRPAFAVTCAVYNLYEVASLASDNVTYIVRNYLKKTTERSFKKAGPADGPTLFVNAAVAPDVRLADRMRTLLETGEPFISTSGQRVAAALLTEGETFPSDLRPNNVTPFLLDLSLPLGGEEIFPTMNFPYHVIKFLPRLFLANIGHKITLNDFEEVQPGVHVGDDVSLPDNAVFHTENGPVVLDNGVKVLDFTYFEGPVYVGPNSRIIERSSVKEFVSIGHTCKIGGEVEATIIEPHSNKQHHGFLGHAHVGSWVNLGAGTSNSDLKNTYGKVRIVNRGQRVETGMQFFGCVIGDYSKSAINTSIFTGKIVGVCSMLYGYVATNVPSFTNYAKSFGQITECPIEQAVKTQARMFTRRDVEQTPDDVALLTKAYQLTRQERILSNELPAL